MLTLTVNFHCEINARWRHKHLNNQKTGLDEGNLGENVKREKRNREKGSGSGGREEVERE